MNKLFNRLAPPGWLRQQLFKLASDSAIISVGGGLAAAISLISLVLSTRIISPSGLGMMLLAQTTMFLVGRICGIQGWNAFTRFGSEHLSKQETLAFQQALGRSLVTDAIGIGLAVIMSLLLIAANEYLGLSEVPSWLFLLFASVHFSKFGGTAAAVLRIFSITAPLAWPPVFFSMLKAGMLLVLLQTGGSLLWVAAIWALHQFLMTAWPAVRAVRELSARGLLPSVKMWDVERFWKSFRFAVVTHFASLSSSLQEFDTIIVGYLMSTESVAVYRLAKDTTLRLIRILGVLTQLAYPVFAQLRFSGDGFLRRFGLRFLLFSFAIGTVLGVAVAIGMWIIVPIAFTPEYSPALLPAIAFSAALPFEIVVRTAMPLLYSFDRATLALTLASVAGLAFLALAALAAVTGYIALVAVAYLSCSVVMAICLCVIVWKIRDPIRDHNPATRTNE